jgi:hypothetical protein
MSVPNVETQSQHETVERPMRNCAAGIRNVQSLHTWPRVTEIELEWLRTEMVVRLRSFGNFDFNRKTGQSGCSGY